MRGKLSKVHGQGTGGLLHMRPTLDNHRRGAKAISNRAVIDRRLKAAFGYMNRAPGFIDPSGFTGGRKTLIEEKRII
jgi:hypothetical protein